MFGMVLLYWAESGVIALFTLLKIFRCKDNPPHLRINPNVPSWKISATSRLAKAVFFFFHFGAFMLVHLLFIFIVFTGEKSGISAEESYENFKFFVFSFFTLFLSHAFSYFLNYVLGREYERAKMDFLLWGAYQRVIYMHLVIMGCVFLSVFLFADTPWIFMAFAVVLKMSADLWAHFKNHLGLKATR